MRHNNFNFTIKFIIPSDTDRNLIDDYIQLCCEGMYQHSIFPEEILTTYLKPNTYTSYVKFIVKDYGVPEVGVDLIAAYVELLFKHCDGLTIDAIIIHPKTDPPAMGAVIKWDYVNNCAVIKVITNQ